MKSSLIKLYIISSFLLVNGVKGQALPVDDFSLPICANTNGGSDTLHFHNDYKCPNCKKSAGNMNLQWREIDIICQINIISVKNTPFYGTCQVN